MKPKILPRGRVAALLVPLALVLAACEGGPTSTIPAEMTGRWLRTEGTGPASSAIMVREHLRLHADGTFTWLTETYGPGGRAEDNLLESHDRGGDWRARGERLALRPLTGFVWRHDAGGSQLDYDGAWHTRHRFEIEGDRLLLHYEPTMEQSVAPYTLEFHRVRE